ncbi:10765_t:CDS:2, partial [Funneliformis geosporum]
PSVKGIIVDINIYNTKLIYIKYKHVKFKDQGPCLKREIIFSEDETELTLELSNNIDPDEEISIKYSKGVIRILLKISQIKIK